MAETIIPVDPIFAALLDFHCANCRESDFNNQPQLLTIEYRLGEIITGKGEKRALNKIKDQCIRCFEKGKNYSDSISARSSCTWRANIQKNIKKPQTTP
jgi:hypothetical protein